MKEGYRLMTTVSVPVFDRKKTSVKTANLLGVAGTDVPIREIEKLVPPYKLGVNGYSFMVNTNGYVLYHPDLRPVFQDILKPNYNSVDFAEVELPDDDSEPRENNTEFLDLRRDLIEHQNVEQVLRIKAHLDEMKRLVQREQRYFTQGIDGTPFSLGIAMPQGYGRYKVYGQIELSLEISDPRSNKAMDHFTTGNWSLHPDWVYCEYKYNQEQEESNRTVAPEEQMLEFLSRAEKPHWKWRSTRTRPPPEPTMAQSQCDKDLVQSLLFDARATNVYFNTMDIEDRIEDKDKAHQRFGITTAFVATRSGLTRWQDFTNQDPTQPNQEPTSSQPPHFMKIHNRAIDEIWYKRAVDYYEEDPDAYVYSVPFDAATRNPEEVLVTATRAIFIEENTYRKAPAAVVGVTIKHKEFVNYFKNETHKCPSYPSTTNNCKTGKTCDSPSLDCYLLDDNGFVVVSEDDSDTGKFFGTLEGTIMESLVQSEVYKRVRIFDYQAVCLDSKMENNSASFLTTPIQMAKWAAHWMVSNVFWMLVKTHLYTLWDPNAAWAYTHNPEEAQYPNLGNTQHQDFHDYKEMGPDESLPPENNETQQEAVMDDQLMKEYVDDLDNLNYDISGVPPGGAPVDDGGPQYPQDYEEDQDGGYPSLELAYINTTHPRPCDKEVYLYKLQNHKLKQDGVYKPVKGKLSNCHTNGCGRPFSVQKVRSTNLILVAVNNLCPCDSRKLDIEPMEVKYDEEQKCRRLLMLHYRKRPQVCVNYHPDEAEIKLCGGAGSLGLPSSVLLSLLFLVQVYTTHLLRS
ncbi:hypothetical protein Pcinc_002195 [Petrolisthes cinctipes]|uniref:Voltage-dependent calcium channel alpha-2/delta subunit conserved region domain-containing protein n=1 Tax=Petrolisthes cinctipes TaxID=88211 RepID=A0AAE1L390_PETCI|nr:hypothetical protein Pcinc_002195 [Petrolisthes cinctipes]